MLNHPQVLHLGLVALLVQVLVVLLTLQLLVALLRLLAQVCVALLNLQLMLVALMKLHLLVALLGLSVQALLNLQLLMVLLRMKMRTPQASASSASLPPGKPSWMHQAVVPPPSAS